MLAQQSSLTVCNCDEEALQRHSDVIKDGEDSRVMPRGSLGEVGNGEGECVGRVPAIITWIRHRELRSISYIHATKCPLHCGAGVRVHHGSDHSVECSSELNNEVPLQPVHQGSRCAGKGSYIRNHYKVRHTKGLCYTLLQLEHIPTHAHANYCTLAHTNIMQMLITKIHTQTLYHMYNTWFPHFQDPCPSLLTKLV